MMSIHFCTKVNLRRVKWPKEGRKCLFFAEGHNLDPIKQVVFQGQFRHTNFLGKEHVILDEPVKLRSNEMILQQPGVTACPNEMHCKLKDAWTQYFQRDSFQDEGQDWVDTIPFINTLHSCPTMNLEPLSPEVLQLAMNKTKTASARGCDGFSTKDYRKMPIPLWKILCDLFHCIEQGASWPSNWVVAKTLCLPKGSDPKSPMDVRPVTILAKSYRVWAKVRGKQIASHLASLVPPTVGGPCKGISADIIAMLTSDLIEEHINHCKDLAGLVLDVVKCYNGIPRYPLCKAMERLGIHPHLIHAFRCIMTQIERHFEIANTVGPSFTTSTGIVEGCGVAVAGMLVVAMLCESVVHHVTPSIYTVMFADNWSFMDPSPENIKLALKQVIALLDSFKMQISPQKSWGWALSTVQRKKLGNLDVNGTPIPVVLHATDLGVDQNYSRKCIHKTKNSKWEKTKGRLGIIKKTKVPKGFKKRLALSSGLACKSYGTACAIGANWDYSRMRSYAAAATMRAGSGASPWLACNVHDSNLDPQFRDIIAAIQAWRRYLRIFPERSTPIHQAVFKRGNRAGPLSRLSKQLDMLGWKTRLEKPFVLEKDSLKINWLHDSMTCVKKILHISWSVYVATKCQHRKHFDADSIDTITLHRIYEKKDYHQKAILDQLFIGRHYTKDETKGFDTTSDGKCPACAKEDSRWHRLFECDSVDAIRKKFSKTVSFAKSQPESWWYYAILPIPQAVNKHLAFLQKQELGFKLPHPQEEFAQIFCDGTAFHNHEPYFGFAASAVIECDFDTWEYNVVDRGIVPGFVQNSYVAEVAAIVRALNHRWKLHIYCDCKAVVDILREAIDASVNESNFCRQNDCLWDLVWKHVSARPLGAIQITKVKAHEDWKLIQDPQHRWHAFANNVVDRVAKDVILRDNKNHAEWLQRVVNDHEKRTTMMSQYIDFALQVNATFLSQRKTGKASQKKQSNGEDYLQHLPMTKGNHVRKLEVTFSQCMSFPWGPQFLWRLCKWASQLNWCGENQCTCSTDISLVELYIDFSLFTGTQVPVCIVDKSAKDRYLKHRWLLRDECVEADMVGNRTLADQTHVFSRAINFLQKIEHTKLWSHEFVARAESLQHLGSSQWHKGIKCRPQLTCGNEAAGILREFFCTEVGTKRTLNRVLAIKRKSIQDPTVLGKNFPERLPFIRKGFHHFIDNPVSGEHNLV